MTLAEFFKQNPKAALGFSGGVDSAYLLHAAVRCGADARPYFVGTAFQPASERADAERLCAMLGVPLTVVEMDILSVPHVAENPADRCYFCKRALFGALSARAAADGYTLLLDGTNASDDAAGRPGMRALRELSVRSPLRECGLEKDEIRRRSKEAGLFTWDKPAYACLATRVPCGEPLLPETLEKIERAEDALRGFGFSDLRVRVYHGAARVQLKEAQLERALAARGAIVRALKPDFAAVLLDLEGR